MEFEPGLQRSGADVHVVTTNSNLNQTIEVESFRSIEGLSVNTAMIPNWSGRVGARYSWAPGYGAALSQQLGGADFCIVQGVWTWPLRVAANHCRRLGIPYLICARGTLESWSLDEKAGKKKLYMRLFERRALDDAHAILYDTEEERKRSESAAGKIRALVDPSALEFQDLCTPDGRALRGRLGIAEDTLLLGLAGRVHPRKGFDVIVDALARCSSRVNVVSFGADEDGHRTEIEKAAEARGVQDRLHFMGSLSGEALQQTFASIDRLILPSHGESFGNVVIEALAQGTPALVSDRVPLGRYLSEHKLGEVVVGLDPECWAERFDRLLEERESFDRQRASETVRKDFDLEVRGRSVLGRIEAWMREMPS